MSEEVKDDDRRKVTSVGNSWIVCKSKSHQGHVYYFNTLTGEAAWNLSDAEIEKAKRRTKTLERQPGGTPTRCPEPKDQPPSIIFNKSEPAQKPSYEPFATNTVAVQQSTVIPFLSIANNSTSFCTPTKQISGVMQHSQFNNTIALDAICKFESLNNPMSTLSFNPGMPLYNPKVWDIPQTQQVFIPPTLTALVNNAQAVRQPISSHILNSSQTESQSNNVTRGVRKFYPRHFNYVHDEQRNMNKTFMNSQFTNKSDLRQKLSIKKRFNNASSGSPGGSCVRTTKSKPTKSSAHFSCDIKDIHSNHIYDNSLENKCGEALCHETLSRIDLEPLKSLAAPDSNPEVWFIVVDLDVLLNEFKFLTTLTDSDEQCHLMVPKRVMSQLRDYVMSTEDIQSRRILRFLSHQIEIGYAFMAEEPSNVESDSIAQVIHATCLELTERKYHLILLSNDNELLSCKDFSNITIFSIDEVKNLLLENTNKQTASVSKKPLKLDELINKIKITVPNNTRPNAESMSISKTIQLDDQIEDTTTTDIKTQENNTSDKPETSIVLKRTADAGIQTDFEDINTSTKIQNVIKKQDPKVISSSSQKTEEILNIPERKREIKLKRCTSNQPPVQSLESNDKRQFRWRRRRNTTPQANEQIITHNNTNARHNRNESQQTVSLHRGIHKQTDSISNNNPAFGQNENKLPDDSMESRESSIYTDQRNSKENVTIEETSTSGIISNTESNVDAESYYSNSTINQQQTLYNDPSPNKPMYEIDSLNMEEYLKINCDEWVSRFIQIMEEVLSQVLQQDPPFKHSAMPPPWTLHEAAQCVAIKFNNYQDIKDAANKLSTILFQSSDTKGNINKNMSPFHYMQMYSYGVHLLAAITKVTSSCEDIEIAVESLRRLLEDIRNPNTDNSTHDNFNDNLHENVVDSEELDVPANNDESTLHDKAIFEGHNEVEVHPNLRSKRRKLSEEPQSVKFIRNVDLKTSFFSSLNLRSNHDSVTETNVAEEPHIPPCEEQQSIDTQEENSSQNTSENVGKETDSVVPNNQPKIIRNFIKCAEFEKKLSIKYNSKAFENHDDELDYEEDYGEYITEEYCSEDENDNVRRNNANVNKTDLTKSIEKNDLSKSIDKNEACEPNSPKVVDTLFSKDNSKKFKYMMSMFLQDIREALCQVRILCHQCHDELKKPKRSTAERCELQQIAEKAHLHLIRLCRSLESMLDRETNNPSQNMSKLLRQADINTEHVDDQLLYEYRIAVAKCKDHANTCLDSIRNIISAFENKL